jgi:hypothetical protein
MDTSYTCSRLAVIFAKSLTHAMQLGLVSPGGSDQTQRYRHSNHTSGPTGLNAYALKNYNQNRHPLMAHGA